MREHEEILDALDARDGKRLAALLRVHLLNKLEAVKRVISTPDEKGDVIS